MPASYPPASDPLEPVTPPLLPLLPPVPPPMPPLLPPLPPPPPDEEDCDGGVVGVEEPPLPDDEPEACSPPAGPYPSDPGSGVATP